MEDLAPAEHLEAAPELVGDTGESAEQRAEKKIRDRWFDPWLVAKGEGLQALVSKSLSGVDFHEKATQARRRTRKAIDQETHKAVVEVVVANLALACVNPPQAGQRIAVPLRKGSRRGRYQNDDLSTPLIRDVLEKLSEIQALDLQLGKKGVATTTISPTGWFANRVLENDVSLDDFGRRENEEVIILKRKHKDEDDGWTFEAGVSYEDYNDTDTTYTFRAEVQAFNRFLEAADMAFIDDGLEPKVNTNDRRLRRYFTAFRDGGQTFDRSGRLFGGWWLHLAKERRGNIRLQGEPVAILDYASMFGRLAYAHLKLKAPEGDIYDLTGLLRGYDTQGGVHRKGVKKVFNAMMFGGAMGKRLPTGAREELPPSVTVAEVREAIKARNPALIPLFGTQVGYRLMFQESQVLLKVLGILLAKDIVPLPLHDGLMVAKPHAEAALEAMKAGCEEITGFSIPVDLKA
jgi:hypothetical protein